jgi:hypothetical protein
VLKTWIADSKASTNPFCKSKGQEKAENSFRILSNFQVEMKNWLFGFFGRTFLGRTNARLGESGLEL